MRAEPKPGWRVRTQHVKLAVVARGYVGPADVRADISERRRGQVFRGDVEHAPDDAKPHLRPLTAGEVTRIRELYAAGASLDDVIAELRTPKRHTRRVFDRESRRIGGTDG